MTRNTKGGKLHKLTYFLCMAVIWSTLGYMAHDLYEVSIRFAAR